MKGKPTYRRVFAYEHRNWLDMQTTAGERMGNAYGLLIGVYEDGSELPVICDHGGSGWLCVACAEKICPEN